jgi:tungstate transport system substrate-binding protein
MISSHGRALAAAFLLLVSQPTWSQAAQPLQRIRLATTTSTEQSGLLAYMLPVFERQTGYKVDVIAVGTGASIKIGEKGDCDVVLAHARALEDAFMAAGFGGERRDVMYNDFVLVGPQADPAGIGAADDPASAFRLIASRKPTFVSRGDNSGTHVKEKELWAEIRANPSGSWYKEAGQGMSQVLIMAGQLGGYTLADRATWLALKGNVPGLKIVFEGGASLKNPYGIMTVNPARWPQVNAAGAKALVDFFTGAEGRALILSFRIGGAQCFFL